MERKEKWQILGLSAAIIAGGAYLGHHYYEKKRPHILLNHLKKRFRNQGKIETSWINCTPIKTHEFGEYHVGYNGGLMIQETDGPHYYEFFVDKHTGELIELNEKK